MEPTFWQERWQRGEIGFHQPRPHRWLRRFWPGLACPADAGVFVPLCGASVDMDWLAEHGHTVVGVELARSAIEWYYHERGQTPALEPGPVPCWQAGAVRIYEGDVFALQPRHLSGVTAVYDRAALIALPAAMRQRYAEHLAWLLPPGARGLVISFAYDPAEMAGPPFSVPEAEIRALLEPGFEVDKLAEEDVLDRHEPFREKGLTALRELVFRCERRAHGTGM